jgi:hypothetical protein
MSGCFGGLDDPADKSQSDPVVQPLGIDECYNCHDSMGLVSNDPVFREWSQSRHGNVNNMPPISFWGNTITICAPCHDPDGDSLNLAGYMNTSGAPPPGSTPERNVIGCEACHAGDDDHFGGGLVQPVTAIDNLQVCEGCHELVDANGDKAVAHHDPATGIIITDTHFGTAGSWVGGGFGPNQKGITGYTLDLSNTQTCVGCHDPHSVDLTRNLEWVQSGHADTTASGAWAFFNWTNMGTCQRCHTTSGAIAFMTSNFSSAPFTPPLAQDPEYKPQMLHCNGCHTSFKGDLREPGAINAGYPDDPFTYPNAFGSNVCLTCHVGTISGGSIRSSDADFTDLEFMEGHNLAAGGILYNAVGYEYDADENPDTDDYNNPPYYAHDQIGMGTNPSLAAFEASNGTNGPCVGCHLSSSQSHLMEPVSESLAGTIIGVTSTICVNCHAVTPYGDFSLVPAELENVREEYEAALDGLAAALSQSGFIFLGNYPYFAETNWGTGEIIAKNNMGAAFNRVLLGHEPGAWAHNNYYTRRLIFDSIDWLDNNSMEGAIDLTSLPATFDATAAAAFLGTSDPTNVARP